MLNFHAVNLSLFLMSTSSFVAFLLTDLHQAFCSSGYRTFWGVLLMLTTDSTPQSADCIETGGTSVTPNTSVLPAVIW